MRILSLATTHPRHAGDAEPAYVAAVNRELARLGHDITTLVPHADGAALREVVDGVTVCRFRYFWPAAFQRLCYDGGILPNLRHSWWARVNLPFFLLAQANAVAGALRRDRFDLLHCHWMLPSGFVGALLRPLAQGAPLVVSAHGSDIFSSSALFAACNRFVLGRSMLCTVNSSRSREQVARIRSGVPLEVVPMGVDTHRFCPDRATDAARARLGNGQPQIIFVGRFSASKGVPDLLRAMPRILSALPRTRLALIGGGPEEAALRRAVDEAGLADAVTFVGCVSRDEMPACMASADMLVLPSVHIEGLGVVLLEALAAGTAVVGTDVGGIPDVVRHGVTGLLSRPADADDLAEKCLRLLCDEELRQRTLAAGRRLVDTRFSWTVVARRFDELLTDCRR